MNSLRRTIVHRLLASFVLAAMVLWAGAPLATAHPQAAAAQAAKTHANGPLEAAVAEALAVASRADDPAAGFAEAIREALEGHPDADAILELLGDADGLARLLDLLVGQILRASALQTPLMMAATPSPVAPSGACGSASLAFERPPATTALGDGQLVRPPGDVPLPTVRELSSAQPLGP